MGSLLHLLKRHRDFWAILFFLQLWNTFLAWPHYQAVYTIRYAVTYALTSLLFSFLLYSFLHSRKYFKMFIYVLLYLLWNYVESTYGLFSTSYQTPPHAVSSLIYSMNIVVFFMSADLVLTARSSGKKAAFLASCLQAIALSVPLMYIAYIGSSGVALTADSFTTIFLNSVQDMTVYIKTYIRPQYLLGFPLFMATVIFANTVTGQAENAFRSRMALFVLVCIAAVSAGYCLIKPLHSGFASVVDQGIGYISSMDQKSQQATAVAASGGRKGLYVVVIGESQTRDNMSAYGYRRKTTPWLDNMRNNRQTVLFKNAYSCHTTTVSVLLSALTDSSQFNPKPFKESVSVIDVLNAAGYRTTWLSNQEKFGVYENPITLLATKSAHRSRWVNTLTYHSGPDGVLLPELQELLANKVDKEVIFIHLNGLHADYRDRYPEDFHPFSSGSDLPGFITDRREAETINYYDNSMAYNDYVVSQIFKTAYDTGRLAGFVSFADHGEAVEKQLGHNPDLFVYTMARVPMFMWFSEDYIERNRQQVLRLQGRYDAFFTNDLFYDTLLGLVGVSTDSYNAAHDLGSAFYSHTKDDLMIMGKFKVADDPALQ